jgi:hypothetical protein
MVCFIGRFGLAPSQAHIPTVAFSDKQKKLAIPYLLTSPDLAENKGSEREDSMRRIGRILWLVFLSIFPISTLLAEVELEEKKPDSQ